MNNAYVAYVESPTSFLKVLAELILLCVLGHLGAHGDDLKRPTIFVMKCNMCDDASHFVTNIFVSQNDKN